MNNSGLREKGFKRSLHLDTDKNHRDSEICSRIGQNLLHKSVLAVNSTYCQKDSTTASSYPETEQNSTSATREFLHGITHSKAKESSDEESKAVARLEWLGYPQELSRQWGFWSSFSFSFINLGTTTGGFWSYQTAYILGGPINLFWGTILAAIVMILQNLVLGELASAYPASGAMFTWAYKLAYSNPKIKDWASYFSWLVAIFLFTSQLLFQVSESWIFASLLIKLISVYFPKWKNYDWQLYGVACLNILTIGSFVTHSASKSSRLWVGLLIITFGLTIAIYVVMAITSNHRQNASPIFVNSIVNKTQIKSDWWAFIIAILNVFAIPGAESAAYMVEETQQAEVVVPRAMFFATFFTYINMIILQYFCYVSFSEEKTLSESNFTSLLEAHCPRSATVFILAGLLILTWIQQLSQFLGSSRFAWALARDRAFPWASFWYQLSKGSQIPRRAAMLIVTISIVSSILLGLPQNNFTLVIVRSDFYLSTIVYFIPLLLYLTSKKGALNLNNQNYWNLKSFSKPFTLLLVAVLLLRFTIGAFPIDPKGEPPAYPIRALTTLTIPVIIIISTIFWFLYGKRHYITPPKNIKACIAGQEVELSVARSIERRSNEEGEAFRYPHNNIRGSVAYEGGSKDAPIICGGGSYI